MKYIFVVGAPGSKWSSVIKNIYFSPDIDRTDYHEDRLYTHSADGKEKLMHIGSYFDPGMEFGDFFDRIEQYSKLACEIEFNRAFAGTGIRIIRSHVLANHIDFLKEHWPECPVVCVDRGDDACLGWWVRCGEFNIKYPNYQYYKNLAEMAVHIDRQNAGIRSALLKYANQAAFNNIDLCNILNIAHPPTEYQQNYPDVDIKVNVL